LLNDGNGSSHFMLTIIMAVILNYMKTRYNNKTGGFDTVYQTPVHFSFRPPGSYIVQNSVGIQEKVRI